MVKVMGGIELAAVGHVGFAEKGCGADKGIGWDLRDEGGVERGVGAGFCLDGDGVGASEGLEGRWGGGTGGRHGDCGVGECWSSEVDRVDRQRVTDDDNEKSERSNN